MDLKYIYTWVGWTLVLLLIIGGLWFFFFRSASSSTNSPAQSFFGTPVNTSTTVTNNNGTSNGSQTITSPQVASQKIFLIAQGPIAGATLIQTLNPTTTLARYINQEDGHVYDLPLDMPGAVPRVVSIVTIPGAERVLWVEQGNAAILQYLDSSVVKSVYLGFPTATTSINILPTRIQFLPDNIIDIAASPDGKSVAYLLKTASGSDGYIAKSDGTGTKKMFSLPLSQVLISWPAQTTLLVQSKSAVGVPGIAFAVDAKSGVVIPLIYAQGLTAIADETFTHVIYQTADGSINPPTYIREIKTGLNKPLDLSPYPEQCIFSNSNSILTYCAEPVSAVNNYLDLWHAGIMSNSENIFSFNINTGTSSAVAFPGSADGGVQSDILEMALSPNEHYLSFTTKGARSLWGVRLAQ
jgi:hypothetical protein